MARRGAAGRRLSRRRRRGRRRAITELHNCAAAAGSKERKEKRARARRSGRVCACVRARNIALLAKWDNATVCDKLGATHARARRRRPEKPCIFMKRSSVRPRHRARPRSFLLARYKHTVVHTESPRSHVVRAHRVRFKQRGGVRNHVGNVIPLSSFSSLIAGRRGRGERGRYKAHDGVCLTSSATCSEARGIISRVLASRIFIPPAFSRRESINYPLFIERCVLRETSIDLFLFFFS